MAKLKRTITWKMLGLYGLGNILGAGIYVLIGEVAATSGDGMIWSFLIAAIVASFTALTYSALAGKFPVSAGAAVYSQRAFKHPLLSTTIGVALAVTAIISSSALLRGFAGYASDLAARYSESLGSLPDHVFMLPLLAILSYFALRGIGESTKLAIVFTLLETGGLLLIIFLAGVNGDVAGAVTQSTSALSSFDVAAIGLGGFLAFYAFVGFEDMVNVAEEVKHPETSMRKGMLTALSVATVIYILVVIAALAVLSANQLADSDAPLASVFEAATGSTVPIITVIGIIAITNGVLIQIITSSRILYGLAREKWLPKKLALIDATSQVPRNATILSIGGIAIGSSLLPLATLAQITSFMLLLIFSVVQLAALKLIRKKELQLAETIPILGLICNTLVIALQIADWFGAL